MPGIVDGRNDFELRVRRWAEERLGLTVLRPTEGGTDRHRRLVRAWRLERPRSVRVLVGAVAVFCLSMVTLMISVRPEMRAASEGPVILGWCLMVASAVLAGVARKLHVADRTYILIAFDELHVIGTARFWSKAQELSEAAEAWRDEIGQEARFERWIVSARGFSHNAAVAMKRLDYRGFVPSTAGFSAWVGRVESAVEDGEPTNTRPTKPRGRRPAA